MIDVVRVRASNPGLFTGPGTNTYVVAAGGEAVVIDPGPIEAAHQENTRTALSPHRAVGVLVTHTHPDHAPAANPLGEALGVPVYGYAAGPDFVPDFSLVDGSSVEFGGVSAVAVHTPGHTDDHLCYRLDRDVFTGDHIMGGSTVVIEDAAKYMDSLRKVRALVPGVMYPGHGDRIDDAVAVLDYYISHREAREHQIIAAVRGGARSISSIVAEVYADVDRSLHHAAALQVFTQLRKLRSDGVVTLRFPSGEPPGDAGWAAGADLDLVVEPVSEA